MAQIWIEFMEEETWTWSVIPLVSPNLVVKANKLIPVQQPENDQQPDARLTRVEGEAPGEQWVLTSDPAGEVRVNGDPPALGQVALRDRDEILIPGRRRIFFSTENLAKAEPFPGTDQPSFCGRCKTVIEKGAMAVCCPGCRTWSHQTDEKACWSFSGTETCPMCSHRNAMPPSYAWTPEGL